jgi:hypothetical protein
MFEGLVAWVLERYLGAYVENLDKSKLKISLYQVCRLCIPSVTLPHPPGW